MSGWSKVDREEGLRVPLTLIQPSSQCNDSEGAELCGGSGLELGTEVLGSPSRKVWYC